MRNQFSLFPEAASEYASNVDALYFYLVAVTVIMSVLIAGTILYFAFKYRRRSEYDRTPKILGSLPVEIAWSVLPFGIMLTFFFWGAKLFYRTFTPPPDAMEIHVLGKQWMWKIQHPSGRREINELHVPVGKPIKLLMTSQDVIHSFYVPAFRLKQDALPGRYTEEWFLPNKPGEYHLFCAEYCGTLHSGMIGRVVVMEAADYEAWLSGAVTQETPAQAGERLYIKHGCITCHGSKAPTLAGLIGRKVQLTNGQTIVADENYIRESILNSTAKIVAGYPPTMPSFQGQLSEEQIMQLIAYIKSLGEPPRRK